MFKTLTVDLLTHLNNTSWNIYQIRDHYSKLNNPQPCHRNTTTLSTTRKDPSLFVVCGLWFCSKITSEWSRLACGLGYKSLPNSRNFIRLELISLTASTLRFFIRWVKARVEVFKYPKNKIIHLVFGNV